MHLDDVREYIKHQLEIEKHNKANGIITKNNNKNNKKSIKNLLESKQTSNMKSRISISDSNERVNSTDNMKGSTNSRLINGSESIIDELKLINNSQNGNEEYKIDSKMTHSD